MACTGFSEECEKYKSTRFSASGLCSVFKNDYLVTDEKAIQSLNTPGRKSVIKAYGETQQELGRSAKVYKGYTLQDHLVVQRVRSDPFSSTFLSTVKFFSSPYCFADICIFNPLLWS